MQRIDFIVHGPPVAWHRAQRTKTGRSYTHADDVSFQSLVASQALAAIARWRFNGPEAWKLSGEWSMHAQFHVHDLRGRDIDNLEKNLLDGLQGTVFSNDKQVVEVSKFKRLDRANPRTVVSLKLVEGFLS